MKRVLIFAILFLLHACRSNDNIEEAFIKLNDRLDSANAIYKQTDTNEIIILNFDSIEKNTKSGDSFPINTIIKSYDQKLLHQQK